MNLEKDDIDWKEFHNETKQMLRELVVRSQETDRQFKETDRKFQESNLQLEKESRRLDKKIAEIGKQIGGIGEKFGYLVEGFAIDSMEEILYKKFKVDHIQARAKVKKDGIVIAEIDVLGYCNSTINNVVAVEVKSQLKPEHVTEFKTLLSNFKNLFPEHKNKHLYGVLATPGVFDTELVKNIANQGIYLATIKNDTFTIKNIQDFKPRDYNS